MSDQATNDEAMPEAARPKTKRTSYVPEYTYGLIPGTYDQFGLIPWPAHLQPKVTVAEEASRESTAFLAVTPQMRQKLAATCEALIALLDEIDGDENVEGTADEEPLLGWPNGGQRPTAEMSSDDDRELDNADSEHELGWQDEGGQGSLQASFGDYEPELGSTEEIDQVRRLETATGWQTHDGEPDLGFCGHGTGWHEGETTDDREQENEHRDDSDFEPFLGWSEDQSLHGAQPVGDEFPRECGGPAQFDGGGERIAKKQLKEHARRKQLAGRKGEILFQRDDAAASPRPEYAWHDQWTGNLPPEAHEVLIP